MYFWALVLLAKSYEKYTVDYVNISAYIFDRGSWYNIYLFGICIIVSFFISLL